MQSTLIPNYGDNILYVGGETCGWTLYEDYHNGTTTSLAYKFAANDPNLTPARKSITQQGAAKWAPYGAVYESPSAVGTIATFDGGTVDTRLAYVKPLSANSAGHLTAWELKINIRQNATAVILAHEFGHAYGLRDLYNAGNKNKLMYGYSDLTATAPTASDGKGFSIIVGQHSSHNFIYASGPIYICNICDGIKKY